jgi:hypothetical protein
MTKVKKIIRLEDCYDRDLSFSQNEERLKKYLLREIADNVVEIFDGDLKKGGVKYYPRINDILVYPSIRREAFVVFSRQEPYESVRVLAANGKIVIYDKKIIMKPRIKNLDIIDPYNEEIWDEMNESVVVDMDYFDRELDPYNEEDWGWIEMNESWNPDKDGFEKIIIMVKTQKEYDELMLYMEKRGYKWGYEKATALDYFDRYENFCIAFEGKSMGYGNYSCFNNDNAYWGYRFVDVAEILYGKKIKRISRPEIDPYEEEDWGYEVSESAKTSDCVIVKVKSQEEYDILMVVLKMKKYCWMGSEEKDPTKINSYIHKNSWNVSGGEKGFYIYLETGKSGKKYISWDEEIGDDESHVPVITVKKYIGESYENKIKSRKEEKAKIKELTKEFDPFDEEVWD